MANPSRTIEADAKAFGQKLRDRREANGWRQSQVAEWAGLDPSQLARYEAGVELPGMRNIVRLCEAFRCSSDWLLGMEESKP